MSGSILVLGAGELGLAVIRGLVKRAVGLSTQIAVLLRPTTINSTNPAKASEISELRVLGVTLIPGDLVAGSVDDLSRIFKPFDTVIGCTGFVAGHGVQRKLARAVLDAEVERYFPWQFGVDYDIIGRGSAQDLFDEQLDVRDVLRSQTRTKWVIISTGMFTSFLFEPFFGVVDLENSVVRALGGWDNSVTVTTPEDIGELTAEIVLNEKYANQVVYTAGDTITYSRLADVLEFVLNRKLQRQNWSVQMLQDELAADPHDAIKKYRVVFAQGNGVSWDVRKSFNVERGINVVDVESWIRENL
ncbi:aromatic alcohol reductase [Lipomyces tetrasporus]|uniref:Aromatic alcohol reductase n=1 Tax=Lipomyces tetrasporus TaxID=54092 RepID=A0AAD7QY17_9ASCO|nr:aromatic alcohol reductase [Lipomyces tetrasporus]KAJ8103426.1 aromatic alcohol reductase [Lipomyces tetrasporus]